MASISAADIKRLRDATGAGMTDCKNALVEADGDFEKAVEFLRVKGLKGVAKREGRSASNGLVAAQLDGTTRGTLLEINCETDFVAKGERFQSLAQQVVAAAAGVSDVAALQDVQVDGRPVKDVLDEAGATLGEKIEVRRVASLSGDHVAVYLHKTNPDLPPQVGVLVALAATSGDAAGEATAQVGKDVAQHIAAFAPRFAAREEVSEDVVAKEREIAEATAREEGKPEQALPRIVEGRVNGFFKETVLVEQAFAKDPKKTVGAVLDEAGVRVTGFARFRVGQA